MQFSVICFSMKKYIALIFVLLPSIAFADVNPQVHVSLSNGDRISGNLISAPEKGEDIVLQTELMGSVKLPRNKVASINSVDGAQLWPVAAPKLYETSGEVFNPKAYKWKASIDAGLNIDSGNSDEQEYLIDAKLQARNLKNRWTLLLDSDFNRKNNKEIENDHTLDLLYDRFVNEKWFYGARSKFEVDKVVDLNLRSRIGPILGYQVFDRDDLELILRAGPEWTYQNYEDTDSENNVSVYWALDYEQDLFNPVRIFHNHEISAPFDSLDSFLFESDTGFRIPLSEHIRVTAGVEFDWQNDPPQAVRKQDLTYSVKLGYEW